MAVFLVPGYTIPAAGGGPNVVPPGFFSRLSALFTGKKTWPITDKYLASGTTLYLDPRWSGSTIMIETASITVQLPPIGVGTTPQTGNPYLPPANSAQSAMEPAAGLEFEFITTIASSGLIIKCGDTTAVIKGRIDYAASTTFAIPVNISTTASTGALTNTAGTSVAGDRVKLVSDGTNWWIVSGCGVWASS